MSDTKDILSLRGILDAAEKIVTLSSPFANPDDFYSDSKSYDAVCMNFIVIGEMAEKLISDEFRRKHADVDCGIGVSGYFYKSGCLLRADVLESTTVINGNVTFSCSGPILRYYSIFGKKITIMLSSHSNRPRCWRTNTSTRS